VGAQGRLTAGNSGWQPRWETRSDSGLAWRSLSLPMLGWEICYALKDNALIVSNSNEMMKAVLDSHEKNQPPSVSTDVDELTIIRFDRRKESFDDIVNVLDAEAIKQANNNETSGSQEFFSGNISSLLNVASDVSRIEIKRKSSGNNLHEQIELVLK